MNLARYFEHADWPMPDSPLGRAVQTATEKRPELTAEQCLQYARQALHDAAGRRHYKVEILSAKQEEDRKQRVTTARLTGRFHRLRGARSVSTGHPK